MKASIKVSMAGLVLLIGTSPLRAQETADVIALPTPDMQSGGSLMQALQNRQSLRNYTATLLSSEHLSGLLWAAAGINRPDSGRRTAPSARNWQGIDVYLARADGLFLYDSVQHRLTRSLNKDLRPLAGKQSFVQQAPQILIYVANATRMMPGTSETDLHFYSATDTGFISQNVYLYCAAHQLATVVVGLVDKAALAQAMELEASRKVVLVQPVGYPAADPVPPPATKPAVPAGKTVLRDGVYPGQADGHVDTVKLNVTIREGSITSVQITQHNEDRPRTALEEMPRRIIQAQSGQGVDTVTGATVTSRAILQAAEAALRQAANE